MKKFTNWFSRLVLRNPWGVMLLIALLTVLLCLRLPNLTLNNSTDRFFSPDDPEVLTYREMVKSFESDGIMLLVLEAPQGTMDRAYLERTDELTKSIEQMPETEKVYSLTNAQTIRGNGTYLDVRKLLKDPTQLDPEAIKRFHDDLTQNQILQEELFSKDQRLGALVVFPLETGSAKDAALRSKLIAQIRELIQRPKFQELKPSFAGPYVVEADVNHYTKRDLAWLLPLSAGIIFSFCLVYYRSWTLSGMAGLEIILPFIWTLGLMAWLGISLTMVSTLLPPLLVTIAVADIIHIYATYHDQMIQAGYHDPTWLQKYKMLRRTFRLTMAPCFMTSLTTAIGFLSLFTSDIAPVKEFGLLAAFGVSADFLLTMAMVPVGLLLLKSSGSAGVNPTVFSWFSKFLSKLRQVILMHPNKLILLMLLIIAASIPGILQIKTETNFLEYFPKDSRTFQDNRRIEEGFSGAMPLTVFLKTSHPQAFKDPALLKKLELFAEQLRNIPQFGKVSSLTDYVKEVHWAIQGENADQRRIPSTSEQVGQALFLYELAAENDSELSRYVNFDYSEAVVSIRMREHSSSQITQLIEQVNALAQREFAGTEVQVRITGRANLFYQMVEMLLQSQIKSFLLAIAVIILLFVISLGSLRRGLISIPPNLFPIAICLGLMGYLGVPLDVSTVMVASICLGIAVDDTIHFMFRYKSLRTSGQDLENAVGNSIESIGTPIVITSVLLAMGFCVLMGGYFKPTFYFGLLLSSSIASALVGDLLFLPALLLQFDRRKGIKKAADPALETP
ncbi:MAG: hypothetical protein A2600_12030 [Candidatus Lambdaproteobacteria bacterium RIFOXYD1_FULL_56_27]|uniref:SSD domain-containing protein n=1 Tax=Candidatus Lambdaproteobacteria bacterium RIFOXYD2_FULL_56_26 TaxID=1817773 RepID=A0A1F6GX01_9PROT|nr:MAG: hypothetical protein A2426_08895 [Candidatus Lambdaproteobacteria bacterium RIFOXYC1_FULL_56_13]OGH02703.1 MAG: hypothetical protein A2557_11515 [Candidatus Lambdaproteobacteria bacterium RIFOXYD2_FULL_56_26]OGH07976.1 MAG: hypothetical protein A2600_12030 [Candidatus Lambdaproteobacteria bacterium RIFOXYD1_FULL_56_27]